MQIWRDEFLRLVSKKMLMLSDEHHTVMSSTVSGPWRKEKYKKLVVQRSLFLWKAPGKVLCQKWSEAVLMDGTGVQKNRVGIFQWKNCSTDLRPYTGFLGLLAASEAFEGGFDVLMLASFEDKSGCRILDFGVCQEDVLENLMEEKYSCQVLTKQRHRWGFLYHQKYDSDGCY